MYCTKWRCWTESAKTRLCGIWAERERTPSSAAFKNLSSQKPPQSWSCDSSFLRWPWRGHFPFVRDFSGSSMQRWRMGSGVGNHSIHTLLFCVFCFVFLFFCSVFWGQRKWPGLLIISVLNGLFKTGRVKVRGWVINQSDNSFPLVELVARLVNHCRNR